MRQAELALELIQGVTYKLSLQVSRRLAFPTLGLLSISSKLVRHTMVFPVPRGPKIRQELLSPMVIVRRISPTTFLWVTH